MELEQLNPRQFERFRDFIYERSGIRVKDNKLTLLSNRIRRRLKVGPHGSFDEYYAHLTSPAGAGEIEFFLDEITTNETFFFRTPAHFEWFSTRFLPEITQAERNGLRPPTLRVWSAGCASGAEPYTTAICLLENRFRLRDWAMSILGTDLSAEALHLSRAAVFRPRAIEAVSPKLRGRYFRAGDDDDWQLRPEVRKLVTFEQHNLMTPLRHPPFDCIFIRNVLIYFDRESKRRVVKNLIRSLAPGGYLVTGPSEGLYDLLDPLERLTPFLYRRPPASAIESRSTDPAGTALRAESGPGGAP